MTGFDPTALPPLIALVAAIGVGALAMALTPPPPSAAALAQVMNPLEDEGEESAMRAIARLLRPLARLMPGGGGQLAANLALAQRALGQYRGWQVEDFIALRVGGLLLGLLLIPLSPVLGAVLAGGLYLLAPSPLNNAAEQARRALARETPDAAETLAFLVGLGLPVDEAMRRLAEGDGAFARLMRYAIRAQPPSTLLSAHFADYVAPMRLPGLSQLAHRLAEIARRGVGERELMGDLASSVAAAYEAEVMARAERLESTLTVPLAMFFFLPFIALLVLPIGVTAIGRLFVGG